MAVYANLKDYFQGEHLDLIKASISEYCSAHQYVGEADSVQVQKLRCTFKQEIPDTSSDLEIEAGVSVQFVDRDDNSDSAERFFLIHISGDLELKLSDIKVNVIKEICESEMPEETIENKFLLPNIKADNIENTGKIIYYGYLLDTDSKSVATTCKTLIEKMKVPIYYADFDDTCLGRINLSESDLDIYRLDETTNELVLHSKKAIYGTIILNKRKYFEEKDGEYLITICHELVHWQFHQKFFKILMLLGNNQESLDCKAQPPAFNDNMKEYQKALCIAEWQANELSWRIAMPKISVEQVFEVNTDIIDKMSPLSNKSELMVYGIASYFGVSPYVAKIRLRQLGHHLVDGTCLEIDGKRYPSFIFVPDSLKEAESFVIDRANYNRLLRENKIFAELITTKEFVYTGYVVCLYNGTYLTPFKADGKLTFLLSEYGRKHADECCLKFQINNQKYIPNYDVYYSDNFFYKLDDGEYSNDMYGKLVLTQAAYNDMNSYCKMKKEQTESANIIAEMNNKKIISFKDAFVFLTKRNGFSSTKDLCDELELKWDTVESYIKKKRKPSLKTAMIICNKLNLQYDLAINLLQRAGLFLNPYDEKHQLYDYLLTITNATLEEWNLILNNQGFKPLFK
ncbi:MAG: ImmA/IrrE family metallo-endopeptidase [Ruminococcus sp.]|nr:ImmA/IrrE family metallo-endopeptidase [Ruminococcus sp.]